MFSKGSEAVSTVKIVAFTGLLLIVVLIAIGPLVSSVVYNPTCKTAVTGNMKDVIDQAINVRGGSVYGTVSTKLDVGSCVECIYEEGSGNGRNIVTNFKDDSTVKQNIGEDGIDTNLVKTCEDGLLPNKIYPISIQRTGGGNVDMTFQQGQDP